MLLVLTTICSLSCSPPTTDESLKVQDVTASVLWSRSSFSGSTWPLAEKDGTVYFAGNDEITFRAINADTGVIEWEDNELVGIATAPVFFENGRIGGLSGENLVLYNLNGIVDKSVNFGDSRWQRNSQAVVDGNTVYFATIGHGLCRVNILTDLYWDGNQWRADPEVLYPLPEDADGDGRIHWLAPVIHQGIAYGGVNPEWGKPGTFYAIDLDTKEILWQTKGQHLDAWGYWTPLYRNDRLIILDPYGFGIIDPATGEILVEHGVYYAGGKDAGGFIYNNRAYYTSGTVADNTDNPNNVKCVDLDTGEAVWMKSFEYSHGSNPVCHEGLTYVFSQDCMRILDAETGMLLGIDTSIHGDRWQLCNVLKYNDTAIVKHSTAIYAVKLNFRTDGKGKLWQEE